MLDPPGAFRNVDAQIALLLPLIITLRFRHNVTKRLDRKQSRPLKDQLMRSTILLISLIAFSFVFSYRAQDVTNSFLGNSWLGVLWFFLSACLLAVISKRLVTLHEEYRSSVKRRLFDRLTDISFRATSQLFVLIFVCYLNISAYAHGVFEYIPASRGGGDLSLSPTLFIYSTAPANSTVALDLPIPLRQNEAYHGISRALALIDQSDMSLFVADIDQNGGPKTWRYGRQKKPLVWEVPRSSAMTLLYKPSPASRVESPLSQSVLELARPWTLRLIHRH